MEFSCLSIRVSMYKIRAVFQYTKGSHMTALLSSNNAANFLGYSDNTLRNSRHTGTLAGVDAPPYIKLGTSVRYSVDDLNEWLIQFNDSATAKGG